MDKELKGIWDSLKNEFSELLFVEESHTYFVAGQKLPSVSSLITNFYDEFDTESEALKYSLKKRLDIDDVKGAWTGENVRSTTKGTKIHNFAEDYAKWKYFNIGEKPTAFCKQSLGVIEFWNNLPTYLMPVALEIQMYSKKYGYCGTADILFYNLNDGTFVLGDYKTNKELFSNPKFPSKPLKLLSKDLGLLQDNFGKYTLQFSFYQILLENIGLEVSSRMLIWLRPDGSNLYSTHRTKDVSKELRELLEKETFHTSPFKEF